MKKLFKGRLKRVVSAALVTAILCCLLPEVSSFAAESRKCYTISGGNTPVYSNTGLTSKYGTIFGSDEISVLNVTGRYTKVTYPISGGRTKTGYIQTGAILWGTTGSTYTSKAKITTYRRPGGASYGYVATGDRVTILGNSGSYTQVKYPVSGGYKYAFITTAEADAYLKGTITSPGNTNTNTSTNTGTNTSTNGASTAQKIVNYELSQVGIGDNKGNNNVKYNTWYYGRTVSGSGYAWCMAFQSYCRYPFTGAAVIIPT